VGPCRGCKTYYTKAVDGKALPPVRAAEGRPRRAYKRVRAPLRLWQVRCVVDDQHVVRAVCERLQVLGVGARPQQLLQKLALAAAPHGGVRLGAARPSAGVAPRHTLESSEQRGVECPPAHVHAEEARPEHVREDGVA
jgi:hypothetical protein